MGCGAWLDDAAAGVRRVEALTAEAAYQHGVNESAVLSRLAATLKTGRADLEERAAPQRPAPVHARDEPDLRAAVVSAPSAGLGFLQEENHPRLPGQAGDTRNRRYWDPYGEAEARVSSTSRRVRARFRKS